MSSFITAVRNADWKNVLEIIARIGAILVVVAYGSGYLIVTVANSRHGIVGFGLFRAKVLTTGILFIACFAIPLLLASTIFGNLFDYEHRPSSEAGPPVPTGPEVYSGIQKFVAFFISAWTFAVVFGDLLFPARPTGVRLSTLSLGYVAFSAGVFFAASKLSQRHPIGASFVCLLSFCAGLALVWFEKEWPVAALILWFATVGFLPVCIRKDIRAKGRPLNVTWHMSLLFAFALVALFTLVLYPNIEPALGGGRPTRTIFQFTSASPIDGAAKDDLWLLDEIDSGYYVLKAPKDTKGVFIPRGLVSAIYFDADADNSQPK